MYNIFQNGNEKRVATRQRGEKRKLKFRISVLNLFPLVSS